MNQEQILEQCAYLTSHYHQHHSRVNFLKQIATDETFRRGIAARIFGMAETIVNGKHHLINLPHHSFDSIGELTQDYIIQHIDELVDGLDPNACDISQQYLFRNQTLTGYSQYIGYSNYPKNFLPLSVSSLALNSNSETHAYQSHLNYFVLLREDSLAPLPCEQQIAMIEKAERLLSLFDTSASCNTENTYPFQPSDKMADSLVTRSHDIKTSQDIKALETQYLELVKFYFPEHPDYLVTLEKFISIFEEHTKDNLKILLQIIISGHRNELEEFIKLLTFLESRCLLDHFYKIYFKYALFTSSVDDLIKNWYFPPVFTKIAAQTPAVNSAKEWPSPDQLLHHVLLYSAKHGIQFSIHFENELLRIWRRLFAKFLVYTENHAQEAQLLMESLVNNLVAEEGLSIGPVHSANTLFVVLEKLLDHAISKHTLKEQIAEIRGLSFLWTDIPYAIANNGFQVVSSDMEIHTDAINPQTKSYSISSSELKTILEKHQLGDTFLKPALFRYLGTETLREDLSFYRKLLNPELNKTERYIKGLIIGYPYLQELIVGYFVLTNTGIHYKTTFDETQFTHDFNAFLAKKKISAQISAPLISVVLNNFIKHAKRLPRNIQKGTCSLWNIWLADDPRNLVNSTATIPEILTRKFEQNQLMRFVLGNSEAIKASIPLLNKALNLPFLLIRTSIQARFNKLSIDENAKHLSHLLEYLYPKLTMDEYIKDIVKIDALIEYHVVFAQQGAKASFYQAFQQLLRQRNSIDVALILSELLKTEISQDKITSRIGLCLDLLNKLSTKPQLLTNILKTKPLFALIIEFYFNTQTKEDSLEPLLQLVEKFVNVDEESATRALSVILKTMRSPEGYQFFNANPGLTTQQLQGITQILLKINDLTIAKPFIQLCLQEKPKTELSEINALLQTTQPEKAKLTLRLTIFIYTEPTQEILEHLKKLIQLPLETLNQLVQLRELHVIEPHAFSAILNSASITDAIVEFERRKYAMNLERYNYDSTDVVAKIALIKHKSYTGEIDHPLSPKTQTSLLIDYKNLMSYMTTNPVLIEQNEQGNSTSFTINELNEKQFHTLFNQLQTRISNNECKHQNEVLLLALCCEALYRTTNKFPRNTQILSLLNSLNQDGNLIHELKTGEGKSIIAALHGVLLNADKRTVDIATENDQLAREGLTKFKRFYQYLGIPCCNTIIEANSPQSAYVANGINYSTAANLSLFRTQMQLEKQPLPQNVSLVCDEIDATLTTTVQYRLAATINPLLLNKKSWPSIYKNLLDFVKEKDVFLNNKCTKNDDITNFKNYCLLRSTEKEVAYLISQIPDELIGNLIESALIANALEEDIDYMLVKKPKDKIYYYAAPILESTKRPDPKVSYSACVQQLLHTRLNNSSTPLKYSFEIEPSSETLVVVSAKNFFDYYRLNGGRTVGFTGTAGTNIELKEFYQQNALNAYSYPTFREDRCENLGLFTSIGLEAHHLAILKQIHERKKIAPEQPILIIASSPKETHLLTNYLNTHALSEWNLQSYSGYAQDGCSEDLIIQMAGQDNTVTISTQSLARGTDIEPTNDAGLFVINTCTDLTESDLRQIQGRAARNGKPGQFCSIIDAAVFGDITSTPEELATRFKAHQQHITITKQKERLKTRLLEEVREHIVSHYFLELRARADSILSKQFGHHSTLVTSQDFMQTISTFNQNTERQYTELLSNNPHLEGPAVDAFFESRIQEYQLALNRWLPENRFKDFKAVEPLIPLENLKPLTALNAIPIEQLAIISELLSTGWQQFGHQEMQDNFSKLDLLQTTFKPYFKQEQSFQRVLAETLLNQNLLNMEEVLFNLNALEKALLGFPDFFTEIPVIGYFIPVDKIKSFITDYFKTTKTQIQEKKWDDLALPTIDTSSISRWWNRINTVMSVSSIVSSVVAGPIPFIVNKILIPAIGSWITSLLKTKFAGSESTALEMVISLSNISTDLSNALTVLLTTSKSNEMTLGLFLDNIAPLLKNKAFVSIMSTVFKLNDMANLIPYLTSMPELIKTLEPYRESKLKETLNAETFMVLLQKSSQFEFVKKTLEKTEYKDLFARLLELKPETLSTFRTLSFQEFLGLIKVIAHPNFFDFLKVLPAKTTFAELTLWLEADLDKVPLEVKEALTKLRDYQSNREKIEADTTRSLLTLKGRYTLSSDKLKAELAQLVPKPPNTSTPDANSIITTSTVSPTPWLWYTASLIGLTLFIALNVILYSTTLLLTSIVLVGISTYPHIKKHMSDRLDSKPRNIIEEAPLSRKLADPIFISFAKQNRSEPINSASTPINDDTFDPAGYNIHGFFHQARISAPLLKEKTESLRDDKTNTRLVP